MCVCVWFEEDGIIVYLRIECGLGFVDIFGVLSTRVGLHEPFLVRSPVSAHKPNHIRRWCILVSLHFTFSIVHRFVFVFVCVFFLFEFSSWAFFFLCSLCCRIYLHSTCVCTRSERSTQSNQAVHRLSGRVHFPHTQIYVSTKCKLCRVSSEKVWSVRSTEPTKNAKPESFTWRRKCALAVSSQ